MVLLYIVKNKSNKIKVITDDMNKLHPDQNWMNFMNSMATYYLGTPFNYESDAKNFQSNRKFFVVTKNKKLKDLVLNDYRKDNEKWSKFSQRMSELFKGDIFHSISDAERFVV